MRARVEIGLSWLAGQRFSMQRLLERLVRQGSYTQDPGGVNAVVAMIDQELRRLGFRTERIPAKRFGDQRIALVGEAAHVIPPIGAQGLNLGLRDAATIGELAIAAHRDGRDIGGADVLGDYEKMRRADVGSRTLAIDLLNRTLLTDFLPVQGMHGLGLYMLDRVGPLRRAAMREGLAAASAQPRLMRGEAL